MFQMRPPAHADFSPILVHDPVYLRPPAIRDHGAWAALREESRAHLTAWEDDWTPEELAISAYRQRVQLFEREARRSRALSLFVFRREDETLVGGVTLTNIRYGAARAGSLGYWIGAAHAGRGYGFAALSAVTDHCLEIIGLNRIEAACQPENTASRALLRKAGFEREGLARDYLKINGKWRDHELYALTQRRYRERAAQNETNRQ